MKRYDYSIEDCTYRECPDGSMVRYVEAQARIIELRSQVEQLQTYNAAQHGLTMQLQKHCSIYEEEIRRLTSELQGAGPCRGSSAGGTLQDCLYPDCACHERDNEKDPDK
jgi:hypothetical protein